VEELKAKQQELVALVEAAKQEVAQHKSNAETQETEAASGEDYKNTTQLKPAEETQSESVAVDAKMTLEAKLYTLENKSAALHSEKLDMVSLSAELEEAKAQRVATGLKLAEVSKSESALRSSQAEAVEAKVELEAKLSALESSVAALRSQAALCTSQERKLAAQMSKIQEMEAALTKLQSTLAESEANLNEQKEMLGAEQKQESVIVKELETAKKEHAQAMAELAKQKMDIQYKEDALQLMESIKRANADLQLKVEALEARAAVLDNQHLVVYSSNTPDKEDFVSMLKCLHVEYEFGEYNDDPNATSADQLIALLRSMVAQTPRGQGFQSIALACHGPESTSPSDSFYWEISELARVTDDKELLDEKNPVRKVMMALAGMWRLVSVVCCIFISLHPCALCM
jgi:hypothetical protein